MKSKPGLLLGLAAFGLLQIPSAHAVGPKYVPIDLGALPNDTYAQGFGISPSSKVTGESSATDSRAVRSVKGVLQNLGTLGGRRLERE